MGHFEHTAYFVPALVEDNLTKLFTGLKITIN